MSQTFLLSLAARIAATVAGLLFAGCDLGDTAQSIDATSGDAVAQNDGTAASCDARIGAKQALCGAPPSLAQLYRDMWCGMSPPEAGIACFESLSCAEMEQEIHAGHFPCVAGAR